MKKKIYYTFRIHSEQLDYLRNKAKTEFTTVTQYLLDLVSKDMKNNNDKITTHE
jgi:hypothetical protein